MRLLIPLLAVAACSAADVTIGQWNGMLIVTAPATAGIEVLGGRLDQRITLDAHDQPLTETTDFLRAATGLNVVVSAALQAKPPTVNIQVKDMALRNVLSWIERTAGVHVGFVNGALFFSDQPVAGATSTRIYDVRDLGMPITNFPGPSLSIPEPGGQGSTLLAPLDNTPEPQRYGLDDLTGILNRFIANKSD